MVDSALGETLLKSTFQTCGKIWSYIPQGRIGRWNFWVCFLVPVNEKLWIKSSLYLSPCVHIRATVFTAALHSVRWYSPEITSPIKWIYQLYCFNDSFPPLCSPIEFVAVLILHNSWRDSSRFFDWFAKSTHSDVCSWWIWHKILVWLNYLVTSLPASSLNTTFMPPGTI